MAHHELKELVYRANLDIVEAGLVELTWGNASAVDRDAGVFAIKPSGVDYDAMRPDDIPLVSIETGERVEGDLNPSSDTPTHRVLYQQFPSIGGVVHTHSDVAVSWAQAAEPIPCLGTTHADHFYGEVPVTRRMAEDEIQSDYEHNTGAVIVERFRDDDIAPAQVPGVLVAGHGPFTWGADVAHAVENAIVLESVAQKAMQTYTINPNAKPIDQTLLDKHYLRKHGENAYYGQER
ncbi:L-ribulose-5-phosphate 4-epimerase [Longimonas halophila]|uniref:L-ribulose-5-phosphate 4-epimerase n=1 Tax=Longimonas halophila TaxID=1469170 RepID=A0A2H3NVI3_9BACT|nr:L-ribulose-5-phosphate 4-epimerase [Longimonas halophila]PEN08717.1 L-ribulose-5-phosphate 4-epimerase [Longimonas halophila]